MQFEFVLKKKYYEKNNFITSHDNKYTVCSRN